jgi:hypothetical protein
MRISTFLGALCLFALPLTASSIPARAATANIPRNPNDEKAFAAFQCAALAASSADDPVYARSMKQDVDRLFRYGVEQARVVLPEDKTALKKVLGDMGPWHEPENMGRDF